MLINSDNYKIINDKVPILTKLSDGKYDYTDCLFMNFKIKTDLINMICSPFGFKNDIIRRLKICYEYKPVFFALTNQNIKFSDFNVNEDVLSIALVLDKGPFKPAWGDYIETNNKYRALCNDNRKYKGVGTQTFKEITKIYAKQGIEGRAPMGVHDFYYKNGCKRIDGTENFFYFGPQR